MQISSAHLMRFICRSLSFDCWLWYCGKAEHSLRHQCDLFSTSRGVFFLRRNIWWPGDFCLLSIETHFCEGETWDMKETFFRRYGCFCLTFEWQWKWFSVLTTNSLAGFYFSWHEIQVETRRRLSKLNALIVLLCRSVFICVLYVTINLETV